ncbi:MAG: hypothetical protein M3680_21575 [Myxococcota bacterium]|nr:hypothetical protein [Myxococcota bacterium]
MTSITWGDTVRIKTDANVAMRPGSVAAVCGMRQVENELQAIEFNVPVGTTLFLVEFGDGVALEIPETFVSREADEIG